MHHIKRWKSKRKYPNAKNIVVAGNSVLTIKLSNPEISINGIKIIEESCIIFTGIIINILENLTRSCKFFGKNRFPNELFREEKRGLNIFCFFWFNFTSSFLVTSNGTQRLV